jgi:hypothetical protein
LSFHSPANESEVSTTYTNSGNITLPKLVIRSYEHGEANFWVTELIATYEDESPVNAVAIMEFRNGKVAHETLYFAYPFEPPEWRSQWVERIQLSSPSLMPELQRNTGLVLEIIEVERSLQADSYRNISTSSTPYW